MPRIKYQNRGTNNTKAFSDRNPIRPVKVYSGGICFWLIAVGFVSRIFYNISAPRPLVFANLVFARFARPKADRTTNEANGEKSTKASNDQRTKKKRKNSQFTRQITRDHSSSFDRDERSQMEFLTRLTRARLLHISRPRADCRSAIREIPHTLRNVNHRITEHGYYNRNTEDTSFRERQPVLRTSTRAPFIIN